jgi:phage gpG-like protein
MYGFSLVQWARQMQKEQEASVKRRERLLYDVASFVLRRAKAHAKTNFGRGIGRTARTAGRSGALMRSISMARLNDKQIIVTAGGEGVPYAGVHEMGTKGKGGTLPSIVPKPPRKWLTIPINSDYVGRRAKEFDLVFFKKNERLAFLADREDKLAYLLLKKVDIPPRPYLQPAAAEAGKDAEIKRRLKEVFGQSRLPYEVTSL